ncbi:MAG: hypothetical protein ACR2HX_05595 [Pyrinomonadaceae bacterium]
MKNMTTLITYQKFVSVVLFGLVILAAAPRASATPPTLQSLVLSPGGSSGSRTGSGGLGSSNNLTVIGGISVTGGITMTGAAAGDRLEVSLSTSNSSLAPVPARVTLTLGQLGNAGGTFTIQTAAVTATTQVTITAGTGPGAKTATLTLNPVSVQSLSLTPQSVLGGQTLSGSITLNAPAPSGGLAVQLSSDNEAATVPATTITIPAGQTSATFQLATKGVASNTTATIGAGQGTGIKTAVVQVVPLSIASMTLSKASVVGTTTDGGRVTGTITLSANAPRRLKIKLGSGMGSPVSFSEQASGSSSPVPDTSGSIMDNNVPGAWVPAGANTATFTIYTRVVNGPANVTITAGPVEGEPYTTPASPYYQGSSYPGPRWPITKTTTLTVNPVAVESLTLNPNFVIGGNTTAATVKLNSAVGAGFQIPLSSSNPSIVTVPAQGVVPTQYTTAGTDTITFTVTTLAVSGSDGANVTAGGQTASLKVEPAAIESLTLASPTINGGSPVNGTVTLNGSAPAGGLSVTLSSSDPVASPPPTVVIPSGQKSAPFTINTSTVGEVTPLTITATRGGVSKTANLKVLELSITQLSLSQDAVTGGSSVNGTLTLNGAAPAGGFTVPLNSSVPSAATVPAAVTVPQGSTQGTFSVTTVPVDAQRDVKITAGQGTGAKNDGLTIEPVSVTSLMINPMNVVGGGSATGALMLNGPAPPDGLRVPLSSANPAAATVPDSVAVPGGQTTVTFQISTNSVTADTQVTIVAGRGTKTRTAEISVRKQ